MPGSRRTLSRIQNATPTLPHARQKETNSICGGDGDSPGVPSSLITQPRHAHIPDIGLDTNIVFELLVFVFSLMSLALQYIHLYKTVWWLPQSHANYALNFYLIDGYLSVVLVIIMGRRVVWCFVTEVATSTSQSGMTCCFLFASMVKVFLLAFLAVAFGYSAYHVVLNHSLLYSLFLCYPMVTYFILFRLQMRPLFGKTQIAPPPEKPGTPKHKTYFKEHLYGGELPHHVCSMSPEAVREEVDYFKTDFNNRIKQVLFNSMLVAYYMGFVPLCFAQNTVYYDTWWVGQHVCLVWISAFVLFMLHFLPPQYVDVLHRCALHLGRWCKVEGRHAHVPYNASSKKASGASSSTDDAPAGANRWSELQVWPQGALVKHVRGLFKAEGINNSAEPGNTMHARFFFMFQQPLRVINWLLLLTLGLVAYQFLLLLQAMEWSHILSLTLLMFSNYYVLFRLLRDRWLLLRSYKDEKLQYH